MGVATEYILWCLWIEISFKKKMINLFTRKALGTFKFLRGSSNVSLCSRKQNWILRIRQNRSTWRKTSRSKSAICGLGLLLVLSRERTNNKPSPHMALLLLEVFLQVLLFCRILKIQFCFLEHKDTFELPLKNLKVPRAFRVNKFIIFFLKEISIHKHHKIYSVATPINPRT